MNVNLDVLEIIFAQLDGAHLVNAALVNKTFLAGAIPALYSSIEYTSRHARRSPQQMSPFATLAAHAHLAVHVKRIAVLAAPILQTVAPLVSPAFLNDLSRALCNATNLCSFVCIVKIAPPLLPHLVDKPALRNLRLCAPFASRQTAVLRDCTTLHSLSLDFPSWNVIDALPDWAAAMQKSLAHLTLFMSQDTNITVLNATLAQLPRLRGLHVIACPRITHTAVLKALSHTPDLRELSLTIFPSQDHSLPPASFSIPPITHLSIDIRASYPGLKSLIARIIARISPRDALAICGGWIGEIKGSLENNDPPPGTAPFPGTAANEVPGPIPFFNPIPGNGHGDNPPPLLSPPVPHGNAHGHPALPLNLPFPPNLFGFPLPFPLGNHNGNNNNDNDDPPGAGPPNPLDLEIDPSMSLISSFPTTLSTLHLPQISPTGLKEVVDRCEGIQLLGIVIGASFTTAPAGPSRLIGRSTGRSKRLIVKSVTRPEVNVLAGILSRARALRELIIDSSPTDMINNGNNTNGSDSNSSRNYALLTPPSVRMLMRDSPLLRRIVAEGRVWESPTPALSPPVPFPQCLDIELTLTTARYGPCAGYNHAHGPPGFGTYGGGYGQMEAGNDHWFWLAGSASGGKARVRF